MAAFDAEKELMVRLWAATLKEMPVSEFGTRDLGELEVTCARCYDAFSAALGGS